MCVFFVTIVLSIHLRALMARLICILLLVKRYTAHLYSILTQHSFQQCRSQRIDSRHHKVFETLYNELMPVPVRVYPGRQFPYSLNFSFKGISPERKTIFHFQISVVHIVQSLTSTAKTFAYELE